MKNKVIYLIFLIIFITGCENLSINNNKTIDNNVELNLENDILKIYTLDVGQAEAILIQYNNKNILIDAGNNSDEERIVKYLNDIGVKNIDIAIATHPDADHIGGMDSVIKNFDVETFFITTDEKDTKTYKDVISELKTKNVDTVTLLKDEIVKIGEMQLDILAPDKYYENTNNNSIVVKLDYNEFEMLFTGDMEIEQEQDLMRKEIDLDVDVLKVGHHGSRTSTSNELLLETTPEYAIISVGNENKYDHPHNEVIDKLIENDIEIYRTDKNGTILLETDGENIKILCEKKDGETNDEVKSFKYIGNKNSKIYHLKSCSSLPKEENQILLENKKEAKNKGFKACTVCNP